PHPPSDPYTLSLHDALPIFRVQAVVGEELLARVRLEAREFDLRRALVLDDEAHRGRAHVADAVEEEDRAVHHHSLAKRAVDGFQDRKSTRLNSSHLVISYAV